MGIRCVLAAAAILCTRPHTVEAAGALAQSFTEPGQLNKILNRLPPPELQVYNDNLLFNISVTFVVSVCLADLEYSLGCRERSLLEAVKRLEQIYLDDYAMRRAAGSLRVWFPQGVQRQEQLRFLREVEDRAIAAMAKKLQDEVDQSAASQMNSPGANDQQEGWAEQVKKWREEASMEARNGTNWSHDWASRTHLYQTGMALHELIEMRVGNR
jgi:hypothetical protein